MNIPICEGRELPKELLEINSDSMKKMQERLAYNSMNKRKLQFKPNIMAFDTETYASHGDLLTICLSNGQHIEFRPDKVDFEQIYELFQPYIRQRTIFFAWNLGFDASVILKSIGSKIIDMKKAEYNFDFEKFHIHYIPRKSLSISDKHHHSVLMYDIASLFGKKPLDTVAKQFLGQQKQYDGKFQDKRFPDNILDDKIESQKVIDYCVLDCQLTEKLSNFWVDNFYKAFGIFPKQYHSAGTIAIQYLKTQLYNWYSFFNIPYDIQKLAFYTYFGGRFEVLQRGTFDNIYHYDINSAYPAAMAIMPDFNHGTWIEVKDIDSFDKKYLKYVGFYQIDVTVNEDYVAPFLYRPINKLNIYAPKGRFLTFTTSMELKEALESYDIELNSIKGYYFIPANYQNLKFNDIIKEMYQQRLNQKDKGQKEVYKVIINSLYGKTAQIKPVPTNFYSPVVCSYITGYCRAQLLKGMKDNKNDIVAIATDAIFSRKPLKVPMAKTKELGKWSFEFHRDFVIFMSGVYTFSYYDHSMKKWQNSTRSRGFKIKCKRKDGSEYKLDLTEEMIHRSKDGKYYIEITYMLPNTIAASIASHNIQNIAKMDNRQKEIDLNGDKKRLWLDKMIKLDCVQSSLTLPVNII